MFEAHKEESRGRSGEVSLIMRPQRDTALAAIGSLAQALDLRDMGTASHSRTVALYAHGIARRLGLSAPHARRIHLAGMLHDIGKIGVRESILNKPGGLSSVEWDDMKRHPAIGARIVTENDLADIGEWILCHHERPDGNGYPSQRTGAEIPLESRILAVADAYEAMTAGRPYQPAQGPREAGAELCRCAGSQFDERVVAAFMECSEIYLRFESAGNVA